MWVSKTVMPAPGPPVRIRGCAPSDRLAAQRRSRVVPATSKATETLLARRTPPRYYDPKNTPEVHPTSPRSPIPFPTVSLTSSRRSLPESDRPAPRTSTPPRTTTQLDNTTPRRIPTSYTRNTYAYGVECRPLRDLSRKSALRNTAPRKTERRTQRRNHHQSWTAAEISHARRHISPRLNRRPHCHMSKD